MPFPQVFRRALIASSVCLAATFVGCTGEHVERAVVEGTVTLDGQPIESGTILFIPDPGVVGPPVQVMIENGTFGSSKQAGPTVGMNTVQIIAVRKTGKILKVEGQDSAEEVQYIPKKYNDESTEKANIEPGMNLIHFELKSN